MTMFFTP